MSIKDTIFSSNAIIILDSVYQEKNINQFNLDKNDIAIIANLKVKDMNSNSFTASPIYVIKDTSHVFQMPYEVDKLGLKFTLDKILPSENKFEIGLSEKVDNKREFVIMKAIIFPYINILWIGCILMAIGTLIAIINRVKSHQ